jgi:hypothetical protein
MLTIAAPADAKVRKVALTEIVRVNDQASLTVAVTPKARCRIEVVYKTGVSQARGLRPKAGSRITWSWKVGSSTHSGRWPITVDCGKSGMLTLRFRVVGR